MSEEIVPVVDDMVSCYVGLDLSLTATGFCMKRGKVLSTDTIKTTPKTCVCDLARLRYISDEVMRRIPKDVTMICVEDFFAGPNAGSAIRIAMLGTVVRMALYEAKISFMVVAPGTLKKHILGKGVGEKSLILREVYRRYGLECVDDNEADACVLCHIAEHMDWALKGKSLDDLLKPQKEVVKTLLVSRVDRGYNLSQDDAKG